MKKLLYSIVAIAVVAASMSSCTMEKRHYTSGYHVEWLNGKGKTHKAEATAQKADAKASSTVASNSPVTVVAEDNAVVAQNSNVVTAQNNVAVAKAAKKMVRAHQITKTVAGGIAPSQVVNDIQQQNQQFMNAPMASPAKSGGEKSQLVALLLCVFLGGIGIHRFYLGYTVIGIVQLLTGGGCGIWALIDLIRIITGDLKPMNGDYDKKF
jgi:TM2 domain-containing membrane protein YozV